MQKKTPLRNLRVFESAARHLSFRAASEELNITASAVSHQIRSLEDTLGFELFKRQDRKVTLTADGQFFYREVGKGLALIDNAVEELQHRTSDATIKISAAPVFVSRWLMPRLHKFYALYPETELNIHPTSKQVRLDSSDADILIRYSGTPTHHPDWSKLTLANIHLIAVCSRDLYQHWSEHQSFPEHTTLLEDSLVDGHQWHYWFEKYPNEALQQLRTVSFETQTQLIEPVMASHGIGLVIKETMQDYLSHGEIFRLYPGQELATNRQFLALCNKHSAKQNAMQELLDWIQDEFQQTQVALEI